MDSQKSVTFTSGEMSTSHILVQFAISFLSKISPNDIAGFPHNDAHLVVINQTLARLYFPNGDAIGHSIKLPGLEDRSPSLISDPGIANSWLQVIGVVGDSRDNGLRNPVVPAVFAPWTLYITPGTQILR
jgi:hypothetical protein